MSEKKRIVMGLELCSRHDGTMCAMCPYFERDCVEELCADTLALMRYYDKRFETIIEECEYYQTRIIELHSKKVKMSSGEAESCIQTIELLKQLAYNIHGVMDIVDARNCERIIALLNDCANGERKEG